MQAKRSRWTSIAITVVSVLALLLACVAIALTFTNKSDGTNEDYERKFDNLEKKVDDHEKRINNIEPEVITRPEVEEIKPVDAFQISTFTTRFVTEALDGDDNTYMHTNSHQNPWMALNLGGIYRSYHVTRVVITNIKVSGAIARSLNLRVGVTNTRPTVGQALALDAYDLCEEKTGQMADVETVYCPDEVSGRYLIIQFRTTNYMNLAEVKIYGYGI